LGIVAAPVVFAAGAVQVGTDTRIAFYVA
jgi:hypothetical protein